MDPSKICVMVGTLPNRTNFLYRNTSNTTMVSMDRMIACTCC